GGSNKHLDAIREQFSDTVQIVSVASPLRAMAELSRGGYIGVYADAEHFTAAFEAGRILQNQRVLAGMPDGVVLMNPDNTLIWGNGRLAEWAGRDDIVGANIYELQVG